MCGRFIMVSRDVLDEIIQEIELNQVLNPMPDWPATRRKAYPGSEVPLIVVKDASLEPALMKWGFEVSWNKGLVFNTRSDSAMRPGGNMWAESIRSRRCIVPTLGFFEPHETQTRHNPLTGKENKQHYLFTLPSSPLFFFAGIYETDRFSLMTTEANASVAPVHKRMPLVLAQDELDTWLFGNYASLFDRSGIPLFCEPETL